MVIWGYNLGIMVIWGYTPGFYRHLGVGSKRARGTCSRGPEQASNAIPKPCGEMPEAHAKHAHNLSCFVRARSWV